MMLMMMTTMVMVMTMMQSPLSEASPRAAR